MSDECPFERYKEAYEIECKLCHERFHYYLKLSRDVCNCQQYCYNCFKDPRYSRIAARNVCGCLFITRPVRPVPMINLKSISLKSISPTVKRRISPTSELRLSPRSTSPRLSPRSTSPRLSPTSGLQTSPKTTTGGSRQRLYMSAGAIESSKTTKRMSSGVIESLSPDTIRRIAYELKGKSV